MSTLHINPSSTEYIGRRAMRSLLLALLCCSSQVNATQVMDPFYGVETEFESMDLVPKKMAHDLGLTLSNSRILSSTNVGGATYYLIQSVVPIGDDGVGKITHANFEGDGGSVVVVVKGERYVLIGSPLTGFPDNYPEVPQATHNELLDLRLKKLVREYRGVANLKHAIDVAGLCGTYSEFLLSGMLRNGIGACKCTGSAKSRANDLPPLSHTK